MKSPMNDFCKTVTNGSKEIIELLNSTILNTDKNIQTAIKWRKLTFGLNGDFHHWLCSIGCTKKATVLYFHFGGLLKDKYTVFIAGESKFLRKIEYSSKNEVKPEIVEDYILQAISKLNYFKENWKKINTK